MAAPYTASKLNILTRAEINLDHEAYARDYLSKKLGKNLTFSPTNKYQDFKKPFIKWLQDNQDTRLSGVPSLKIYHQVLDDYFKNATAFNLKDFGFREIRQSSPKPKTTQTEPRARKTNNKAGDVTSQQESLACYYCAAYTAEPNKPFEYYTYEVLKKYEGRTQTTSKLDDFHDSLDESWFSSCYKTAKALYHKRYIDSSHTFHRGSTMVNQLETKAKAMADEIWGVKMSTNDRWNPADIYAIRTGRNTILPFDNLEKLNKELRSSLELRSIVPVSLKKVEGTNAKLELFNMKKTTYFHRANKIKLAPSAAKPTYSFSWYYMQMLIDDHDGKYPNAAVNFSHYKGRDIGNFRKNASARAGSMGAEHIKKIEKDANIRIMDDATLKRKAQEIIDDPNGKKSQELWTKLNKLDSRITWEDYYAGFSTKWGSTQDNSGGWKTKNTFIMAVLYAIDFKDSSQASQDKFVTQFVTFAESKNEWSGPYVKVS